MHVKKELRDETHRLLEWNIGAGPRATIDRTHERVKREKSAIIAGPRPAHTCKECHKPQREQPTHSYELVSWFALARCLLVALRCCSLAVCTAETAVKACEGRVHRYVHMHVGAPF